MTVRETKRCQSCEDELPLTAFSPGRSRCKPCRSRIELKRLSPEGRRAADLRSLYGLTPENEIRLRTIQDNRCAICEEALAIAGPTVQVDHDHTTGQVRGLLCARCNQLLARARDSIQRLQAACDYLTNPPAFGLGQEGSVP